MTAFLLFAYEFTYVVNLWLYDVLFDMLVNVLVNICSMKIPTVEKRKTKKNVCIVYKDILTFSGTVVPPNGDRYEQSLHDEYF